MKKLFRITVTFLYFLFTVGVGVNMHYCSGELEEVGWITSETNCCCGGENEEPDCCWSDQLYLALGEDQISREPVKWSAEQEYATSDFYEPGPHLAGVYKCAVGEPLAQPPEHSFRLYVFLSRLVFYG